VPYEQLPAVDRWLLSSHARLMAEVQEAYDTFQVPSVAAAVGWLVEAAAVCVCVVWRLW
jgi:isoleucyl-tRNA synthetase